MTSEQSRKPEAGRGQGQNDCNADEIAQQEWEDTFERLAERDLVGHGVDHVNVEADRRGDQPDLDDDQGQNPEPDGNLFFREPKLKPGDKRKENRNRQQDHGQAVHYATEDQIDEQDANQDRHRRQFRLRKSGGQLNWDLGQREKAVIDLSADQDEEDRRGGLRSLEHA